MNSSYSRPSHVTGAAGAKSEAPNAALLIDFDNVTMGMRSDLSKELKNLLNSDFIKGKVTVQRAYADWRRYPQYIVPLSENSVDLIFAPAYGSSKKNATDIRMAIDAMELVFIRPEIGTFILLTGDSDFSSVVLKLKEYGKYVIGVGIQESSSDILVQNCDEYYSYTSIAGLRQTTDAAIRAVDPWVLVEQAVERMASRDDVMRSDRLKQVMIEIDPSFDEGNFGYSKFSKFLTEAAGRDLVKLRKMENGQYEVRPAGGSRGDGGGHRGGEPGKVESRERTRAREDREAVAKGRERPGGGSRAEGRKVEEPRGEAPSPDKPRGEREREGERSGGPVGGDPLQDAYGLLRRALGALASPDHSAVRDSDLKRKMLELEPSFDEGELGFGKFSRFLRQAHDHEVVDLQKREEGTYQVTSREKPAAEEAPEVRKEAGAPDGPAPAFEPAPEAHAQAPETPPSVSDKPVELSHTTPEKSRGSQVSLRLRRGGTRGRREAEGPPPLLEGQVVATSSTPPSSSPTPVNPTALGLPIEGPAMIRYLTHRYKGVGQKTAESLVGEFGPELYQVMQSDPDRIRSVIPANRAEQLLKGWQADLARREERLGNGSVSRPVSKQKASGGAGANSRSVEPEAPAARTGPEERSSTSSRRRTRKGGRGRGRDGSSGGSGESGRDAKDAGAKGTPGEGLLLDLE